MIATPNDMPGAKNNNARPGAIVKPLTPEQQQLLRIAAAAEAATSELAKSARKTANALNAYRQRKQR